MEPQRRGAPKEEPTGEEPAPLLVLGSHRPRRLAEAPSQAAPPAPRQQVPSAPRSMLPTRSLCSIVWLNRGFKLRKVQRRTNTGQA